MGSSDVTARLEELLRGLVEGTIEPESEAPEAAKPFLDDLLSRVDTCRDAALIVLTFAVEAGPGADVATPPTGRRAVAQALASLLDDLNIRARRDAFQTLAKGSSTLLGRDLLEWAQEQEHVEPLQQATHYMASRIAATARNLPPMPALDTSRLTFRVVLRVVDDLLNVPSGGAHEQFVFASLLHALVEEHGGRRVETKTLSAADASAVPPPTCRSSTAARSSRRMKSPRTHGRRRSLRPWPSFAITTSRVCTSSRPWPAPWGVEIREALSATLLPSGLVAGTIDLSVLDVRAECRSLVHRLGRPGRRAALNKLWEHLALRQPNDDLVAGYVALLHDAGLVAES